MPTTQEENKATLRRFHEVTSSGDAQVIAETIDEIVAPDALIHSPLPLEAAGAEAVKQLNAMLRRVFPDIEITIEDLIAEDDKVVSRNHVVGTHLGEYMGVPATGRRVAYDEIFIVRFARGRITETWGVVDIASQMKQLGLIPG